ncbi:MAG: beta-ketoacyl synthase N-terminal-like domain-containing protein, partial [Ktedonobacteraceae bacterium]
MNEAQIRDSLEDIAIIGMAGRFPGARNIDEFWSNLRNGVEAITFFSDEELIDVGIDPELLKSPYYVKAGAPLEGASLFDANFFGYSGREAELMDPQQRIFLECAWEALEDACYDPERYTGRIGLFAGTSMNSYLLSNLLLNQRIRNSVGGFQAMIMQLIHANDKDYLATRVSYKLGLRGVSITVQTACSTSLVAACLACQSLLDYRCDIALAGGVSVAAAQKTGYMYQEGGILSPDGHCRAFDAQAQGTVFGNGVGVVVLKRLEDALAAGDQVYAVIKGSAINNDGSAKV